MQHLVEISPIDVEIIKDGPTGPFTKQGLRPLFLGNAVTK